MPISSNLLIKLYALPEEQRATLIKQMVEYKDRLVEYYVWELWDVTTMNSVWFEKLVDKKDLQIFLEHSDYALEHQNNLNKFE